VLASVGHERSGFFLGAGSLDRNPVRDEGPVCAFEAQERGATCGLTGRQQRPAGRARRGAGSGARRGSRQPCCGGANEGRPRDRARASRTRRGHPSKRVAVVSPIRISDRGRESRGCGPRSPGARIDSSEQVVSVRVFRVSPSRFDLRKAYRRACFASCENGARAATIPLSGDLFSIRQQAKRRVAKGSPCGMGTGLCPFFQKRYSRPRVASAPLWGA